jgi:hypothetical protein
MGSPGLAQQWIARDDGAAGVAGFSPMDETTTKSPAFPSMPRGAFLLFHRRDRLLDPPAFGGFGCRLQRGPIRSTDTAVQGPLKHAGAKLFVQRVVNAVPDIGTAFVSLEFEEKLERARGDYELPLLRHAALEHESPGAVAA